MNDTYIYPSPLGALLLVSDGRYLNKLEFLAGSESKQSKKDDLPLVLIETIKWLDLYFSRKIPDFTPKFKTCGSDFQKEVWSELTSIPYGELVSYGNLAETIAAKKGLKKMSAQAVGGALKRNPIAIIIPCHRVVGKNGSLAGYNGGIEKKEYLLKLEKTKE